MRCPSLAELPPPPPGRTGWPWTEESLRLPDDRTWPGISIVTPSYQQGEFIEETIRSILLQGYPDLEYFIMDAGSKDGTVEIIKKYEKWLAGWVSEKDRGMAHAVNKGWARATGEILAFMNTDDWYYPGAFGHVAKIFVEDPGVSWLAGDVNKGWSSGEILSTHVAKKTSLVECMGRKNYGYHQPGMFWRKSLVESVGNLNETRGYSFCHDFWIRSLLQGYEPYCLRSPVSFFRSHSNSQSINNQHLFIQGDWKVYDNHKDKVSPADRRQIKTWLLEYEADLLYTIIYSFLAEGKRASAIGYFLRRISLFPKWKPKKALIGLLYHLLITGSPPAWFEPDRQRTTGSQGKRD